MNNIITVLNLSAPSTGNFLVDVIKWLIGISSSVAVGIILFTLILKILTFPLDFVSKISMRKNSLKMEELRPELEKLQKQYANDKELYNRKVAALYKKNGTSMFGACLPTIVTLVFFIIAINAFTAYSGYKNLDNFYQMSLSYDQAIYDGLDCDGDYVINDETGKLIINYDKISSIDFSTANPFVQNNLIIEKKEENNENWISITSTNGYIEYQYKDGVGDKRASKIIILEDKLLSNTELKVDELTYSQYKDKNTSLQNPAVRFLENICENKSAERYREVNDSFLWVKNIWVTDSPLSHPINASPSTLNPGASAGCGCTSCNSCTTDYVLSENTYDKLVSKLDKEKDEANGYFVLPILTALISFLMQFITMKSQKAQMELQTVDGQGMSSQKMMTWMMPIMYAIFAFSMTASFSVYMVISSVLSILSTLFTNYVVDKKYKNKASNKEAERIHGRIHNTEKPVAKKPEKKKKNKEEISDNDFLSGKVGKKKRK